jgi:hypothetical protein
MRPSIYQVMASLPRFHREQTEAHYGEPRQEVEERCELCQIGGKPRDDVATALNIKKPSVSKIDRHIDIYVSTLRRYVEATGGKPELSVKQPPWSLIKIEHLGYLSRPVARPSGQRASSRRGLA